MTGKITNIEEHIPHLVQETVCLKCLHRWIDVRPTKCLLKSLECPNCSEIGFVIGTGELIDEAILR